MSIKDSSHIRFHSNVFELKVLLPSEMRAFFRMPGGSAMGAAVAHGGAGEPFARWVLTQAGLCADAYRGRPLERRTPACLRALGVSSEKEARARLTQDPKLMVKAVNALLVGVTEFFRDPWAMEALEARVDENPGFFKNCRIWSAGCSSGAEAYTLAMVMEARGLLESGMVLGTDCRETAIGLARAGRYPRAMIAGVPGRYAKYFEAEDEEVVVGERIKAKSTWRVGDVLGDGAQEGGFHVVACRNLLIYLSKGSAHKLLGRLYDSLLPGGLLLTGQAETAPEELGFVRLGGCVYRKESQVRR